MGCTDEVRGAGSEEGDDAATGGAGGADPDENSNDAAGGDATGGREAGSGGNENGSGGNEASEGGAGGASDSQTPGDDSCCVPAAPPSWTGPVHFFEGPEVDLPDCEGAVPVEAFTAGVQPAQDDLACSPCECGEPGAGTAEDPTCTASVRAFYGGSQGACGTSAGSFTLTAGTCAVAKTAYVVDELVAQGGTCSSSGGEVSHRPPARWEIAARGCMRQDATKGSCGSGQTCVAEPGNGFDDDVCIYRLGARDCPDSYPSGSTYYLDFDDERGCSACSCGEPQDLACTVDLAGYNAGACSGTPNTDFVGAIGECQYLSTDYPDELTIGLQNIEFSGSCAPESPGTTTGQVTAANPLTVCCR